MTCSFPPWPILISPLFSRLHVQYVISYFSSPASLCCTVTAFICSRHFIAFCCICQRSVPQSNFPLSFKLSKNFLAVSCSFFYFSCPAPPWAPFLLCLPSLSLFPSSVLHSRAASKAMYSRFLFWSGSFALFLHPVAIVYLSSC